MAESAAFLVRLVAHSVCTVTRAGKIIRDVLSQGRLNIVDKGCNDLQTEADRSVQRCIVTSLSRVFPNITIIGEENVPNCPIDNDWIVKEADQNVLKLKLPTHLEDVNPKDICVWVDPLDGTMEYTQGLVEHVTVLVGVAIGQKAVGGIIHQPYYKNANSDTLGRTLWGIVGAGYGGFEPIQSPDGKRIITTTRSHSDTTIEAAVTALQANNVIRVGGAGYKVILLLEGKAHAYVFAGRGAKKWDTCGPEAILHAVGGVLTDFHGQQYSYEATVSHPNTRGILATAPGESHQWYLKNIPETVKDKLQ